MSLRDNVSCSYVIQGEGKMFQQATYQIPEELGEPQKLRTEQAIIFSFNATNPFVEPGPQKYYFYLLRYNYMQ